MQWPGGLGTECTDGARRASSWGALGLGRPCPPPSPPRPRNRGAWLEQSQRTEALPTKGPRGIGWAHPWPCLLR